MARGFWIFASEVHPKIIRSLMFGQFRKEVWCNFCSCCCEHLLRTSEYQTHGLMPAQPNNGSLLNLPGKRQKREGHRWISCEIAMARCCEQHLSIAIKQQHAKCVKTCLNWNYVFREKRKNCYTDSNPHICVRRCRDRRSRDVDWLATSPQSYTLETLWQVTPGEVAMRDRRVEYCRENRIPDCTPTLCRHSSDTVCRGNERITCMERNRPWSPIETSILLITALFDALLAFLPIYEIQYM